MQWDDVERLIKLFKDNELGELEFEDERFRLKLQIPQTMGAATVAVASPIADAASVAPAEEVVAVEEKGRKITSPFVGNFYRQPAPDAAPYVEVGQVVTRGQVLCIVEAMKLMNEIEAEISGRIGQIYVENGKPVQYGEPLFLIEPL